MDLKIMVKLLSCIDRVHKILCTTDICIGEHVNEFCLVKSIQNSAINIVYINGNDILLPL